MLNKAIMHTIIDKDKFMGPLKIYFFIPVLNSALMAGCDW